MGRRPSSTAADHRWNGREVIAAIDAKDPAFIGTRELHEAAPGVVFMFPGQGSQYVNMGRDLHASEPVFAQHFDQCSTCSARR
jgi:phthiocerol/phenolphthiocerol synthesis type-I polyketide synthase E